MAIEVTDFQKEVLERSRTIPVLVDFWAEWCGPCKVLGPILERLAAKNGDRWVLAKVDTDRNQDLAVQYGVRGIPNVKLFVNGAVADEFTGALPESAVVRWLDKALPNKSWKVLDEAEHLLLHHDVARGRKLLDGVIANDPANERAKVLLAGTYLATEPARAVSLVAGLDESSEHYPMVEAIRTIGRLAALRADPGKLPDDPVKPLYLEGARRLLENDYDGALEKFIAVIRQNRYYDEDGARKACIAIFRMLGDENEVTTRRRREFSSALYV